MTAANELDKAYEPKELESHWYAVWEKAGYFAPKQGEEAYCIMLPPPNITGSLHLGHALETTIIDALIRFHRMQGNSTLWQGGTDHASIATEMIVTKRLAAQGIEKHTLGREAFLEKVWEWKAESGGNISRQLRRLGASVDWSRECFTLDEGLTRATLDVFVRLYDEGLIYRGTRLVNWDPVLRTAVSDLEAIATEEPGQIWHIRYPLANGQGHVVVATTRPETLLGDVAVAVHPADERYQHLIGQQVVLPLTGRTIPVIADDFVEIEFGSGCVKITPAHDFNDYAVGIRHQLEPINILTETATLNDAVPEAYRGLLCSDARKKIVDELEAQGLLEKIEPHLSKIPRGEKSGAVLQPYLTNQWFVRIESLAKPAIEAVESGQIKFIPENCQNIYFAWMRNIQDWCISRQLWWGHRIPAWYDKDGNVYVAQDEAEARDKYEIDDTVELTQDSDVLDTWFSAALWPFATLGWPEKTPEYKTFYPTNVLVTGFDIIFFWVARMIMMGLKFTGQVPFKEVYIHGLIRDAKGQKMSKSKGNVIDPLDLIDGIDLESLIKKRTENMMLPSQAKKVAAETRAEYKNGIEAHGTDALRFTLCALASNTRNINFDIARLEGYRHFCNKLWNATRYVLMNTEGQAIGANDAACEFSTVDHWILSELQTTIATVTAAINEYRFDLAAQAAYEFVWYEYCDWYLELSKPVLTDKTAAAALQQGTRRTLLTVLETVLRLLHPFMPYITEALWQRVAPLLHASGETIMQAAYPLVEPRYQNATAAADIAWLKAVILAVRNIRGEMRIAPAKPVPLLIKNASPTEIARLNNQTHLLSFLAKVNSIQVLSHNEVAPAAATGLVGEMEILIPLAGLIDKAAETARLQKEIEKLRKELTAITTQLQNPNYTAKAPAQVVADSRARATELTTAMTKLEQQLVTLSDV